MKFIMSLIALAALSVVTSAFAQDESPSPTPEESPSATPEEKASATVEEKPSTSASVEPKAQKKEEPVVQKSTAAPKKETNVTTAAPASGKKMSTKGALRDMENRWASALAKHDVAGIEPMVADDFVGVSSKGKVQNRRAMLAEVKGDKDTYTSTKNEKLDVHMYGSNVAVVVGTYREKGTAKDGKAFDRSYRFTDTWMDRSGKWQCVASQVSVVASK